MIEPGQCTFLKKKKLNILSVRFNTFIKNMKHLGDRNSRTVFAHPSQFILVFTDGHAIEKKLKPSNTVFIRISAQPRISAHPLLTPNQTQISAHPHSTHLSE